MWRSAHDVPRTDAVEASETDSRFPAPRATTYNMETGTLDDENELEVNREIDAALQAIDDKLSQHDSNYTEADAEQDRMALFVKGEDAFNDLSRQQGQARFGLLNQLHKQSHEFRTSLLNGTYQRERFFKAATLPTSCASEANKPEAMSHRPGMVKS